MKKNLLGLLLGVLSFNSYGFALGLDTAHGANFGFYSGGDTTSVSGNNLMGYELGIRPIMYNKIGLSLVFGTIEDPVFIWGFNYRVGGPVAARYVKNLSQATGLDLWRHTTHIPLGTGMTLDGRLAHYPIGEHLQFYIDFGVGLDINWSASGYDVDSIAGRPVSLVAAIFEMNATLRLPLGIRYITAEHLELFLQVVPEFGLGTGGVAFAASIDNGSILKADLGIDVGLIANLGATLGIRYFF